MKILKYVFIIFFLSLPMTTFVNCSKLSTSLSEESGNEATASINFKAGFIAPTSSKGKAVRSIRRSTETQLNQSFVTLKEYRHKTLDRYFLTARIQDQNLLENDPSVKNDWEQTGQKIIISEVELAGYSPLCRFYNNITKTHFYTANVVECEQLKAISGFVYEGIEGFAVYKNSNQSCGSLVAVKRLFANSIDLQKKRHRYLSDDSYVGSYVNKGWEDEKLSFCAEAVTKPTLTTVYPVDYATATSIVWNPGITNTSISNNQICTPGSTTTQGCPVFVGGTSVRRCNAAGTGYGQCRASCNSSDDLVSGMTSQTPSCVRKPACPSDKKQCAGSGFNLAQDEYSIDCGDDSYDYNRDTVNGVWNYLGYGIIQRKDNPAISGPVCCMSKDGSGLGCITKKVNIVPGQIVPDETYSQQNPPVNNPPVGSQSCNFNNQTVAHGSSVIAYQAATVSAGSNCVSQQRVCQNGVLSGSYLFASCAVLPQQPAPPTSPAPIIPSTITCLDSPQTAHLPVHANIDSYPYARYGSYYGTSTNPLAYSMSNPRLKGNTVWPIKLVVDSGFTSSSSIQGILNMSYAGTANYENCFRKIVISKNKCDTNESNSGNILMDSNSMAGAMQFSINAPQRATGSIKNLSPGIYYINITTMDSANTGCETFVEFNGGILQR